MAIITGHLFSFQSVQSKPVSPILITLLNERFFEHFEDKTGNFISFIIKMSLLTLSESQQSKYLKLL